MAKRALSRSLAKAAASGWNSRKHRRIHQPRSHHSIVTRPLTILYAEDEENDVFFLRHAFKLAGLHHTVKAVPDGAQALEYLAGVGIFADRTQHPFPDLILLDINMPKQSGLDVLK